MANTSNASPSGRTARLAERRVTSSLLSAGDSAALGSVGLCPCSEVIGAVANSVHPHGFYASAPPPSRSMADRGNVGGAVGQAYVGNPYLVTPTYTSSTAPISVGTPPTITALKSGYRTALSRLVAEARTVGADGVVGVRVTRTVSHQNGSELWSFLAVGSAVRSTGHTHPDTPFTTDLSGTEVAAALRGGLVPIALVIVPCLGIKWVDISSRSQRRRLSANGEVSALTDLVNVTRHQAREDFAAAARAVHADAAVLSTMDITLEDERGEPVATALVTMTGTALGQFGARTAAGPTVPIMPLRRRHKTPDGAGSVAPTGKGQ